jgi:hypothetical protein
MLSSEWQFHPIPREKQVWLVNDEQRSAARRSRQNSPAFVVLVQMRAFHTRNHGKRSRIGIS